MEEKIYTSAEILNKILHENNLNATEFCKIIGKTQSFVSDVRSGKTPRFSLRNSELIASHFPQYSVSWMVSGRPPIYAAENVNNSVNTSSSNCGNITTCDSIGDVVGVLVEQLKVKYVAQNLPLVFVRVVGCAL